MTLPKILVSGATGKIGTEVVQQLLQNEYPVGLWYVGAMPAVINYNGSGPKL